MKGVFTYNATISKMGTVSTRWSNLFNGPNAGCLNTIEESTRWQKLPNECQMQGLASTSNSTASTGPSASFWKAYDTQANLSSPFLHRWCKYGYIDCQSIRWISNDKPIPCCRSPANKKSGTTRLKKLVLKRTLNLFTCWTMSHVRSIAIPPSSQFLISTRIG